MKVLEANPLALFCGGLDGLDGDLALATTHRELVVAGAPDDLLSEGLQLLRRIGTWRDDKEDRLVACRLLLIQSGQTKWSGLDILVVESLLDELLHGRFEAIRPGHLDDEQLLEGGHASSQLFWELKFSLIRV